MALSQAAGSSQSHKLTNKHYAVSTPSALQEASHFWALDLGADERQLELDEDDCIDGLTGHRPRADGRDGGGAQGGAGEGRRRGVAQHTHCATVSLGEAERGGGGVAGCGFCVLIGGG